MGKIRVLVVDDSQVARSLITAILADDPGIEIVAEAKNGSEAVQLVEKLKPNIVTMDVEMPVMSGLEAVERIMAETPVPILVVTSRSDSATAHSAISKGALDLVPKPDVSLSDADEFVAKVKLLSRIKVVRHVAWGLSKTPGGVERPVPSMATTDYIVAVASSAGGPLALSVILGSLQGPFPCPIVIAQHHSEGFVPGMVQWFRRICKIPVKVAEHAEQITPGTVYVSPSERNMQVTIERRIALLPQHPQDIYHPSCDMLLSSAARSYRAKAIGVILTGMGSDGARGMQDIKHAGGTTIAQDEETSIVFGMPKVAIERGCVDRVLPLDRIASEILKLLSHPLSRHGQRGHHGH